MLRYTITRDPRGPYVVLPVTTAVLALHETYATRAEAREAAARLNKRDQSAHASDASVRR